MARYIDADKVVKLIKNYGKGAISDGQKTLDPVDDILLLAKGVDLIPTADVVEVKHSEWLPSPDGVNPIRCKECNTPAPFLWGEDDFGNEVIARYPFKYCPYCGAKMKGGAE